ncbi:MAG: hypothetical protein ACKOF9_16815, partial [Burkholderiales bacterium]
MLIWQQPLASLIWFGQIAILGTSYWVSGRLGLSVPQVGDMVSLVWPPSGLALVALIRFAVAVADTAAITNTASAEMNSPRLAA